MLRLSAAAAAMIMVFMVSLHLPASPSGAGHCLRQGECPFAMTGRWVSTLCGIIGRFGIGFMRTSAQKL